MSHPNRFRINMSPSSNRSVSRTCAWLSRARTSEGSGGNNYSSEKNASVTFNAVVTNPWVQPNRAMRLVLEHGVRPLAALADHTLLYRSTIREGVFWDTPFLPGVAPHLPQIWHIFIWNIVKYIHTARIQHKYTYTYITNYYITLHDITLHYYMISQHITLRYVTSRYI